MLCSPEEYHSLNEVTVGLFGHLFLIVVSNIPVRNDTDKSADDSNMYIVGKRAIRNSKKVLKK